MPNLISVTQRGPDILAPVRSAVGSPIGQEIVGGVRKAGAILKNNPYSLMLSELIFPPSFAPGTLTEVIKRHGHEAAPDAVGLFRMDPDLEHALKTQKSQMDAGISGTFVPVR